MEPNPSPIKHSFDSPISTEKHINWIKVLAVALGAFLLMVLGSAFGVQYFDFKEKVNDFPISISPTQKVIETDECAITGCNSELCVEKSEAGEVASICVQNKAFDCLSYSQCKRQDDGQCGWTKTPEYLNCLDNITVKNSKIPCESIENCPVPMVECDPANPDTCITADCIRGECVYQNL